MGGITFFISYWPRSQTSILKSVLPTPGLCLSGWTSVEAVNMQVDRALRSEPLCAQPEHPPRALGLPSPLCMRLTHCASIPCVRRSLLVYVQYGVVWCCVQSTTCTFRDVCWAPVWRPVAAMVGSRCRLQRVFKPRRGHAL